MRPPPTNHQREAENQAEPADCTGNKDHRAVEHHEQEKAAHNPGPPFRGLEIAARVCPSPNNLAKPDKREEVIEIEAAAPVPTGELHRLAGGIRVGRRMAPMVIKVKRRRDVSEKGGTAGGVQPPRRPERFIAAPRSFHYLAGNVERQRQPHRAARQPFASVHAAIQ